MFSINLVSRETGISAATLRKWEERYGFPKPRRENGMIRRYSQQELLCLREVKRQIDKGMRPAQLLKNHATLLANLSTFNTVKAEHENKFINDILTLLSSNQIKNLRALLDKKLKKLGILKFIEQIAEPLTIAVGEKWANGSLTVFAEHYYSQQMSALLHSVTKTKFELDDTVPKILLGTLPNEKHTLGIAMVHALLSDQQTHCINLGAELPLLEFAQAAEQYQANIIGISFSSAFSKRAISPLLIQLRAHLAPNIALWIGGSGAKQLTKIPTDIQLLSSPSDIISALAQYKKVSYQT